MPSIRTLAAVVLLAPWAVWAVVRLFGLDVRDPAVAVISFTPYVAASAWLPVAAALALRQRVVALAGVVTAAALVAVVLPRALGDERVPAIADGPTLRVMSVNVYVGRADMAAVLRLARDEDIDVLSLQELNRDAVARLDAAGGRTRFPHRVLDTAGNGLFARLPLRNPSSDETTRSEEPEADLRLPGARPVRIKAIHPRPPTNRVAEREWRAALTRLPRPGDPQRGALRVLAGDFNGTLDHRAIRGLLDDGYVDAADATGSGLVPTWPRGRPRPPITIDHVLLDERLGVRSFSVHDVPGTDHRAVAAELVVPRD